MNWKAWLAIVAALLVAFVVFTHLNRQQWVKKDVERQMEIARLQTEAEKHAAEAKAADRRKEAALRTAESAIAERRATEGELAAMQDKWRNRKKATAAPVLEAQLADADALILRQLKALRLADQTIFALQDALLASEDRATALQSQVAANERAWEIERERTETWQQQTRRGRVKTAFLTIGASAAGGLAGYGVGVAVQ